MTKFNTFLFLLATLIWGSTWIVITLQLGVVDPLLSVFYRFFLSALICFAIAMAVAKNKIFKLSAVAHFYMALQGILLFGLNYYLIYIAQQQLSSALVAVIFTCLIFFNIIFDRLFFNKKITVVIVVASIIGFAGVCLLFWQELTINSGQRMAIAITFIATICASLGNSIAYRNSIHKISLIVNLSWSMLYSSLFLLILILMLNIEWQFQFTLKYIASLLYLSIFGSVIAFFAYIKLLSDIGARSAGYIALLIPLVALLLSVLFENLQFKTIDLVAVALLLFGSYLALINTKGDLCTKTI